MTRLPSIYRIASEPRGFFYGIAAFFLTVSFYSMLFGVALAWGFGWNVTAWVVVGLFLTITAHEAGHLLASKGTGKLFAAPFIGAVGVSNALEPKAMATCYAAGFSLSLPVAAFFFGWAGWIMALGFAQADIAVLSLLNRRWWRL